MNSFGLKSFKRGTFQGIVPWPAPIDGARLLDAIHAHFQEARPEFDSPHYAVIATLLEVQYWCSTKRRYHPPQPASGKLPLYRRGIVRWVMDHHYALAVGAPEPPSHLCGDIQDGWAALLAIADVAGGEWPRLAREAASAVRIRDMHVPIVAVELLERCLEIFRDDGLEEIATRDLLCRLNTDIGLLWGMFYPRGLSSRQLAGLLRRFGIGPENIRLPNGARCKGYRWQGFYLARCLTSRSSEASTAAWDRTGPGIAGIFNL